MPTRLSAYLSGIGLVVKNSASTSGIEPVMDLGSAGVAFEERLHQVGDLPARPDGPRPTPRRTRPAP